MAVFRSEEELREHLDRWRKFNEWEAANSVELTPQEKLAAVAGIYRLLPAEAIARNERGDGEGFRRLLDALERLRG